MKFKNDTEKPNLKISLPLLKVIKNNGKDTSNNAGVKQNTNTTDKDDKDDKDDENDNTTHKGDENDNSTDTSNRKPVPKISIKIQPLTLLIKLTFSF